MDRMTYRITDENRRRLELLKAFAVIGESYPTLQEIVNRSIESYFAHAYDVYSTQHPQDCFLKDMMEELLPQESRENGNRLQISRRKM